MVPSFIVFCLLSIECYQDPINSGTSNATSINENVIVSHACNTSAWQEYIYHYRLPGNESKPIFLFVVNFHFPFYEKVNFIVNQFFVEFRKRYVIDFDVILLGPKEDKERRIISNGLAQNGHYSYHSLTVAYDQLCLKERCFYKGFFLINDDSYIDPLFLSTYDLSQSWSEPSRIVNYTERWLWYKRNNTQKISFRQAYENALRTLLYTEDGKECGLHNKSNWRRGYSDAFYIVARDMPRWYRMMLVMKKNYVFLEMAVPTVNWCLTKNQFIDCNHGAMLDKFSCVHMHPVKYRKPNMTDFSLQRMDHLNMKDTPPRDY